MLAKVENELKRLRDTKKKEEDRDAHEKMMKKNESTKEACPR
jgi:hypothetical protein